MKLLWRLGKQSGSYRRPLVYPGDGGFIHLPTGEIVVRTFSTKHHKIKINQEPMTIDITHTNRNIHKIITWDFLFKCFIHSVYIFLEERLVRLVKINIQSKGSIE